MPCFACLLVCYTTLAAQTGVRASLYVTASRADQRDFLQPHDCCDDRCARSCGIWLRLHSAPLPLLLSSPLCATATAQIARLTAKGPRQPPAADAHKSPGDRQSSRRAPDAPREETTSRAARPVAAEDRRPRRVLPARRRRAPLVQGTRTQPTPTNNLAARPPPARSCYRRRPREPVDGNSLSELVPHGQAR